MSKFVEVLKTGLTVASGVRRSGERVQVSDAFQMISKKEQTKKWGAPRYREITRADFEATGGKVLGEEEAPVEEPVAEVFEVEPAGKFEGLVGLNVEDTLQAVAGFDEEELAEFIVFEQANENRKGVLEPLGISFE